MFGTIVQISVDTVVRLSEIENIVAIKDAGGDVLTMTEIIEKQRTTLQYTAVMTV